ncbi:hypothetical protein ABZ714_19565 [Streptomyces sp. NPDC006798]|uniref:hypothetical protein n=1 Tax=Streptomyces sp. NPDC006798 TaxID=3155462 RepID=UPI0033F13BB0
MTHTDAPADTTGAPLDARRAAVRRHSDAGLSGRAIARTLGIGEATVRRDLAAIAAHPTPDDQARRTDDAPAGPAPAHPAHLTPRARRAAETDTALRQLADAAAAVRDARVAYAVVPRTVARGWLAQLRHTLDTLDGIARELAEYYPDMPTSESSPLDKISS